jgi:hypothetical protein
MSLAFYIVFALAVASIAADVYFSEKAFAAGAIEGNEEIRDVLGERPGAVKLFLLCLVWFAPLFVAAFVRNFYFYAFCIGYGALGAVKHFTAAYHGYKLVKG